MDSLIVGCMSDTHGNIDLARKVVTLMGEVDIILHAGDNYRDAELLQEEVDPSVIGVVGNCDYEVLGPVERVIDVGQFRFLLTHGHKQRVKGSLDRLVSRCQKLDVNVCVFGHTHEAVVKRVDGLLLVNPGSVARPRRGLGTFAVIDCVEDEIRSEIMGIEQIPGKD